MAIWKVYPNKEITEAEDRYVIMETDNIEIYLDASFWINENLDDFSLFIAMKIGRKYFKDFVLIFSAKNGGCFKFIPTTIGDTINMAVYIPQHILIDAVTELKIIKAEYEYFNSLNQV